MNYYIPFAVFTLAAPVTALADGNTLFIIQGNTGGGNASNTLFVDQSLAADTTVAGDFNADSPAVQNGSGNVGSVTVRGSDSAVSFAQGTLDAPASNNTANISTDGNALFAQLQQFGIGNVGAVNVTGFNNSGSLLQKGNDNTGSVTVSGADSSGTLNQDGSNNVFDLSVSGNGTNVTYNLVGSNITAANVAGPSVFSNAGQVTVTQTVLGSSNP